MKAGVLWISLFTRICKDEKNRPQHVLSAVDNLME
jgi:hypothetical protein